MANRKKRIEDSKYKQLFQGVLVKREAKKEKCDRISAILPKGTTERIKALGLSINGFINDSVLAELERLERDKSSEPPF